ncbi:MAG: radical SAM protein, partial [Candidatus Thermoplasmatota archaeon]
MQYFQKRYTCKICGVYGTISYALGICSKCIKTKENAISYIEKAHEESRRRFALPLKPQRSIDGIKCKFCVNECSLSENEIGYCGVRTCKNGRIMNVCGKDKAIVQCYHDPLPTNCVGDPYCPGGTGIGYPKYSYSNSPEYGYNNLAVFYCGCSFNCLFCQNWHHKALAMEKKSMLSPKELASFVNEKTSCICFFGGDPTPQITHAIE